MGFGGNRVLLGRRRVWGDGLGFNNGRGRVLRAVLIWLLGRKRVVNLGDKLLFRGVLFFECGGSWGFGGKLYWLLLTLLFTLLLLVLVLFFK